jgi:hypothetical protein
MSYAVNTRWKVLKLACKLNFVHALYPAPKAALESRHKQSNIPCPLRSYTLPFPCLTRPCTITYPYPPSPPQPVPTCQVLMYIFQGETEILKSEPCTSDRVEDDKNANPRTHQNPSIIQPTLPASAPPSPQCCSAAKLAVPLPCAHKPWLGLCSCWHRGRLQDQGEWGIPWGAAGQISATNS